LSLSIEIMCGKNEKKNAKTQADRWPENY